MKQEEPNEDNSPSQPERAKPYSRIRAELEQRLGELTARAEGIDDDLSAAADDDWEENAIESEDDEVLEGVGRIALAEISQIKFALSRIDAGTYGVCTECGNTIDRERLKALPSTTKCVKCT